MRTLTDATLFTVNGPRGCYYAIRNHETGAVLTERTEIAAAALANEKDLLIVEQREVSHAELLELMAHRGDEASPPLGTHAESIVPPGAEHGSGLLHFARRFLHG